MWIVPESNFDALDIRWSTMRSGIVMDAPDSRRCFMILVTLIVLLLEVVKSQGRHIIIIYSQSLILACFLLCGLRFDLMFVIIHCLTETVLEWKICCSFDRCCTFIVNLITLSLMLMFCLVQQQTFLDH